MSTSLTTDQIIASAPGAGIALEKRSIQMRMFKSKTNILKCVTDQIIVPLGQIAGVIYDVVEKPGTLPNGEAKTSLLALGDFQAINYETGEVLEAKAAYLPGYFAEALRSIFIKSGARVAEIGIEICAEPTGLDEKTNLPKSIPFAYGVKNLIARRAADPLEQLKRRMVAAGMLRLPAPPPVEAGSDELPLTERGEYWTPENGAQDLLTGSELAEADERATGADDETVTAALTSANAAVENRVAGRKGRAA